LPALGALLAGSVGMFAAADRPQVRELVSAAVDTPTM
jgi:hypothetical protein